MKKIKEIRLGSYSAFFCEKHEEDELTISRDEIYYTYEMSGLGPSIDEGPIEKEIKWKYCKSYSNEYQKLFDELVKEFEKYKKPDMDKILDGGGFGITIFYNEGKEKRLFYHYCKQLYEDKPLLYIFSIMQNMIPKGEARPALLRKKFKI